MALFFLGQNGDVTGNRGYNGKGSENLRVSCVFDLPHTTSRCSLSDGLYPSAEKQSYFHTHGVPSMGRGGSLYYLHINFISLHSSMKLQLEEEIKIHTCKRQQSFSLCFCSVVFIICEQDDINIF